MSLLNVSWKNIKDKGWSSLLSIILIAFGVGLLCLLVIFRNELSNQFEKNQAGVDLVVGAKGSPLQLILNSMFHVDAPNGNIDIDDAKFIFNPKNPYIKDAVPLSIGDSYKRYRLIGTNMDILKLYPTDLAAGEWWKESMEVTIGATVANSTGLKLGDEFFSAHGFNEDDLVHDDGKPFVVKGIMKPHGSVIDKLILTSYQSVWDVHATHDHGEHGHEQAEEQEPKEPNPVDILNHLDESITSILVRFAPDKKRSIPVINMPRNINENTPLMATAPAYELNKLLANVGSGLKALAYLAYLIAFISALSIFISLYNNLKERMPELAIMRTSGASPMQLFMMIIFEALIIACIGALIGIVLAHLAVFLLSGLLYNQFHYGLNAFQLYREELWIFIITIIISVIAAIIPAVKAYNTDVIKSL